MTIYRLNRVPDKLHVALLDLLGHPARRPERRAHDACASGSPRPPTEPIEIPGGDTEVGTPRTATDESIIFQVDEDFTIPPMPPGGLRARSAAARSRTSASPTARRARRAPTSSRSAARRRSATRSTSASRSRSAA